VYGYIIDGKTEGVIEVLELDEHKCHLCWFFVNKAKHNLGIGQKLFNFVLEKFHDRVFELDVRADNHRAIYIYRKYGFSVVSTYDKILNGIAVKIRSMKRELSLLESVGLYFMDDLCERNG
jgi:ribosomal protein S18 acetylase RimI-like enzyme